MKRIPRDPVRFDVFRAFAAGADTNLHDQAAVDGFKASVDTSIKRALDDPKFLYGQHVQAMFQGVVIALGQVRMIKEEDASSSAPGAGQKITIPRLKKDRSASASILHPTRAKSLSSCKRRC